MTSFERFKAKHKVMNVHVVLHLGIIPYNNHSKMPKPSGTFRIEISHQFMYPKPSSDINP